MDTNNNYENNNDVDIEKKSSVSGTSGIESERERVYSQYNQQRDERFYSQNANPDYERYYRTVNDDKAKTKKAVNEDKNKPGMGKKIIAGIFLGLCFGVFAALGFEGVSYTTKFMKNKIDVEKPAVEKSTETKDKVKLDEQKPGPIEKIIDEMTGDSDDSAEVKKDTDEAEATAKIEQATVLNPSVAMTTVTDVTEVVKKVMPSVVAVNNKYIATMNYFGQIYSQEGASAGSGIIVGQNDSELLIVTNHHVVDGAKELSVTFANNEVAEAQLKGTDANRDLAVIAVQIEDIPADTISSISIAALGDSDALTVGEPVVAIGNSLGYGQSVTTGVVSALNRTIRSSYADMNFENNEKNDEELPTFIQTDAAINPGNSGGALLNMYGQVIGINSSKIGGSIVEGMGYAIPVSDAKPIIEDLMNKQTKVKVDEDNKGYLGITGINVEKQYSEIYGMPIGVYISSVTEGTGAAAAGLVRGDIIVAVEGDTIETMNDLKKQLSYYSVGTTITLTIMQGSPTGYQPVDVEVTLGADLKHQ